MVRETSTRYLFVPVVAAALIFSAGFANRVGAQQASDATFRLLSFETADSGPR